MSANLVVGLDTRPALANAKLLKDQLRKELSGLRVDVQIGAASGLASLLKEKNKISIDSAGLTSAVRSAIESAVSKPFRVTVDTSAITGQVSAAIAAGLTGVQIPKFNAAPQAAVMPSAPGFDQKMASAQVMATMSDAMANAMGKAMEKASKQVPSASVGFSASNKESGMRLSIKDTVNPIAALKEIDALNERARQDASSRDGAKEIALINKKRNEEDLAWAQREQADRRAKQAAFEAAERSTIRKISEDESKFLKAQIAERMAAERQATVSSANHFASLRKVEDEIRSAKQEQARSLAASFKRGAALATETRIESAEQAGSARGRLQAFKALQSEVEAVNKRSVENAWKTREQEYRAGQAKAADMERLAALAVATRKKETVELQKQVAAEIAEYNAAEQAKAAAAKAAANQQQQLQKEAQRSASETFKVKQAVNRFDDQQTTKAVKFVAPGQDEIRRLEGQIKKLAEAGELVKRGRPDLAIRAVGQEALAQLPQIDAMRQRLEALKKEAAALRANSQAEKLRAEMTNVRASAETSARASNVYTGLGVKAAGAKAVVDKFGAAGEAFINNDELVKQAKNLEVHRKAVNASSFAYKRFRDNMQDVHSMARGLAGSLGMLWVTWGNTAPIVAAAALGATMRSTFTVGKDLEFQLKFVSVLTDGAAVSLEQFGNAVRGSMTTPVEAAQGLRALAQNGLSARDALAALPTVLNLATVGEMGLAEAALGATGVMAAFNLQISDLPRVADVFAKAAAMSNTSVSQMVEAMKQASTVGDKYGISLEETAASLATLAQRNITGSAAGTAFRNMMVELATPTAKAKAAMAQMHLELYDGEGQLKSYTEILGELRSRVALMDEKSKLTFLNDLFNERGAKAANAILSDFSTFSRYLDEAQNKARGFGQAMAEALKDTTEGKLKALVTEFQLSTATAFQSVSKEANYFIDRLRLIAGSTEFQQAVAKLATTVGELTLFMVENGKAVLTVIGAWAGLRTIGGLASGIFLAVEAFNKARLAGLGLSLALGAAAGPIGAVIAGVAAIAGGIYFFTQRTSEAEKAQLQFGTQLDLMGEKLNREYSQLVQSNQALSDRIRLMREGKSASEINALLDQEAAQREQRGLEYDKNKAQSQVNEAKSMQAQMRSWAAGGMKGPAPFKESEINSAVKAAELAEANLVKLNNRMAELSAVQRERQIKASKEAEERQISSMQAFNSRVEDVISSSGGKIKAADLKFSTGDMLIGALDDPEKELKRRETLLNKMLQQQGMSYKPVDKQGQAAARASAKAEQQSVLSEMNRERQELEQMISLRRKVADAQLDSATMGPEMAALVAQQQSMSAINKLREFDLQWRDKLKAQLLVTKDEAQKKNLETAIEDMSAKIKRADAEIAAEAEIVTINALKRAKESAASFSKLMDDVTQQADKVGADAELKFQKKYVSPEQQIRNETQAEIENKFASAQLDLQQRISFSQAARAEIANRLVTASEEDAYVLAQQWNTLDSYVQLQQRQLEQLKEQLALKKAAAGDRAVQAYENSLTPEAGIQRFWEEYRTQGKNSADFVYSAVKSSTDKMKDAWTSYAATGKFNSRQLINSIIADLGRLAAERLWGQLLGMIGNMSIGGTFGGAIMSNAIGYTPGVDVPGMATGGAFANGGIMTPGGPIPLRAYSSGGIADSPQMALFGEGRQAEAYVPLPDGRSIPVTMAGGGGSVVINSSPTINIDSRSDQAQVGYLVSKQLQAYHESLVKEMQAKGVM